MKKIITGAIMSVLTFTTAQACNWQYQRYNQSVEKWNKIDAQFNKNFTPPIREIEDILNLDVNEQQYNLVDTQGQLDKHFFKVWRYKEGRPGIILCGIVKDSQEPKNGIVVDLGWIPESHFNFTNTLAGKKINFRAIIRKPEFIDKTSMNSEIKTYIDLEQIGQVSQLNSKSQSMYLERIGDEDKVGGLFEEEEMSLYPFPTFKSSITKPYLTPDKHQAYCMFWGSCTILGIFSLFRIMRF